MSPLEKLIKRMEALNAEIQDLAGKVSTETDPTRAAGLKTLYDGKVSEFDGLKTEAERLKVVAQLQAEIDGAKALTSPPPGSNLHPLPGSTTQPLDRGRAYIQVDADPTRDALLRTHCFLDYCAGKSIEDRMRDAMTPRNSRLTDAQDALLMPDYMAKSILGLPYHGPDVRAALMQQAYGFFDGKVILSTDATGGSTDSNAKKLLAPQYIPSLLKEPVAIPNLIDLVRPLVASNGKATWPMLDQAQGKFGGVAFTWKATEGADKASTEPKFKDFEILTNELSGWTELSNTALRRSAIDLETTLMQLFRDACRYEFSKMIYDGAGSGSNQPQGLKTASGVVEVERAVADQVSWADLNALEYAISQGNRVNARYLAADGVEQYLKSKVDGENRPLFTADVNSGMRNMLAGFPYLTHEYGEVLGDAGDVVFGNFNNYGWAVEEEVAIARSDHAEFKKGRIVFRLMCFVGGKPIHAGAFSRLVDPGA